MRHLKEQPLSTDDHAVHGTEGQAAISPAYIDGQRDAISPEMDNNKWQMVNF
jgi:hypothetical protein